MLKDINVNQHEFLHFKKYGCRFVQLGPNSTEPDFNEFVLKLILKSCYTCFSVTVMDWNLQMNRQQICKYKVKSHLSSVYKKYRPQSTEQ